MDMRDFGRTGIRTSILGFGCGAVGGLMVRGDPKAQERTIARALDVGVNYFDTAVQYGDGESERNLGRILKSLKPADAVVGTKVRLQPDDFARIGPAIAASLDGSLGRLGMGTVDVFHLHNPISRTGDAGVYSIAQVMNEAVPAMERLRDQGKIRVLGLTAVGETAALHDVVGSGRFGSAQVTYNMLNPSAGAALPPRYPAQDHERLFDRTASAGVGVVGIRVLAGGALSGSMARHPIASPPPAPIASAGSYEGDVARAQRLMPLVTEGFADSLTEAATRFSISHPAMGSILVGMATPDEFEAALAAVRKGPLSRAALDWLAALQAEFSGEAR